MNWTRNRKVGTVGAVLGLLLAAAALGLADGKDQGIFLVLGVGFFAAGGYRAWTG